MKMLFLGVTAMGMIALLLMPMGVSAQARDPVAVLDARQAAENAGDVEGALATFADDAVVRLNVGTPQERRFVGKEQIRRWLEDLIRAQNVHVESVGQRQVQGDKVTWTSDVSRDEWRRMGIAPLRFWGEASVQGGKIRALANGLTPESLAKLQAAARAAPIQLPRTGTPRLLIPLVAAVLLAAGLVTRRLGS